MNWRIVKNRILSIFVFLSCGTTLLAESTPSELHLSAAVSSSSVPLNQTFSLQVVLSWRGAVADYTFEAPKLELANQATVVSSATTTSSWEDAEGPKGEQVYTYLMQPLRQGTIGIPSVSVSYQPKDQADRRSISTPPFELEVTAAIVAREFPIPKWVVALAGVVAACIIGGSVLYVRHRRKCCGVIQTKTPIDELRERLQEAGAHRGMSESRDYALLLDGILRAAWIMVKDHFGDEEPRGNPNHPFPAACPHELVLEIKSCQEILDRVKYAGHRPGSTELDRFHEVAHKFLAYLAALKGE